MNKKNFSLKEYQASFLSLIKINKEIEKKIKLLSDLLKKVTKNNGKVILFGNGGSASIASHVATDLVKNANIKAICLNETSYLTCLANDFGYEKWITKSIEFHCDKKDLVILISSSGNSPNMIDAAKFCKKKKINLITFTGKSNNNRIKSINSKNMNFWVDSHAYNHIELAHLFLLLSTVDMIIGKSVYKA